MSGTTVVYALGLLATIQIILIIITIILYDIRDELRKQSRPSGTPGNVEEETK